MTEEARAFLQQRLALFGRMACLVTLAFLGVILGMDALEGRALDHPANRSHLLVCAAAGAVWLSCRGRALRHDILLGIDLLGTFLLGKFCADHAWHDDRFAHGEFGALLSITNILLFRAILVPSRAWRTLGVSLLAAIPSVLPALRLERPGLGEVVFLSWAGTAVAAAVVTSAVIHGLREEIREARRLGQYLLEEKIGEGGMGEVYRARHLLLKRPTAVKLLRPDRAGEDSIRRFEKEVQLTSRLTHPNTVSVFDYGRTPDGVFYYAMELLPGLSLAELVRRHGPQPPGRVIRLLRQACASLAEAHGLGLVHRDIKPANLLLCERGGQSDVLKVLDFGLVKDLGEGVREGVLAGTPHYLSPEAIREPDSVDARSDLYALGAVGYLLLCGREPLDGEDLDALLRAHLEEIPLPPSQHLGKPLPADLEALLLRCLEKDPARRPASAPELDALLAACADAGAWTEADARAWWRERDGAAPPEKAVDASAPTLTVIANP